MMLRMAANESTEDLPVSNCGPWTGRLSRQERSALCGHVCRLDAGRHGGNGLQRRLPSLAIQGKSALRFLLPSLS